MEESTVAVRPSTLQLTPDPYAAMATPSPFSRECDKRHFLDLLKEHDCKSGRVVEILKQAVTEELAKFGIEYEFTRSKSKVRKSPRIHSKGSNRTDGLQLTQRIVEVSIGNVTFSVPIIVQKTCDFIREHIKQQGIFRISGVSSRANSIMQRFINQEAQQFTPADTVHDVASVLKQYLRELDPPLIPHSIHHVFIQCLDLQLESVRTNAILMATCLIPPESIGCLIYILTFLAEVAKSSEENLMTCENLSIIMGLNIMPTDPRKDKGKDVQKSERQSLDQHNKIVEILIKNAERVGQLSVEVEKRLDSLLTLRSSEDELENEGVGRRKKRRSGSLNRLMFGFLKKVTSGKTGPETPITPLSSTTPGGDSFTYNTPIIMRGRVKQSESEGIFAPHRKKGIFDRKKSDTESGTPNTLPDKFSYPSPIVCIDPSPVNPKQTPNHGLLKNFVTPALLRRNRDKSSDADKNGFSAPTKTSKSIIRFGRSKTVKKAATPQTPIIDSPRNNATSIVSIHNLARSPRASTLERNPSSSRIPRPSDKPPVPPKQFSTAILKNRQNSKSSIKSGNCEGDYVTISGLAQVNDRDIRNEAFLASSSSFSILTNSDASTMIKPSDSSLEDTKSSTIDPPPPINITLTPMIREIDALTRTAQDLTLSTLKGKSTSSIRSTESRTLPASPTDMQTTPMSVHEVESKFIKTLKETKIIEITSDAKKASSTQSQGLHRRLTIQEGKTKILSPAQRRIVRSSLRKTQEVGRVTPITPIRFHSLRTPKKDACTSPSALKRSPTRCTLRRGRPNTARTGLPRPSPVRSNSSSRPIATPFENKGKTERTCRNAQQDGQCTQIPPKRDTPESSTPIRRMSSVQELVSKLENNPKGRIVLASDEVEKRIIDSSTPQMITRSKVRQVSAPLTRTAAPILLETPTVPRTPLCGEFEWTSGHKFKFDRKDLRKLEQSSDRDSIHFLKTRRAGKVPATVEYFNKIGHKSPTKSMIPRYTALHCKDGSKQSLNSNTPEKPSPLLKDTTNILNPVGRLSRRSSSVDINLRIKHEQLLESIKRERGGVKRSATTAGSYRKNIQTEQSSVIVRNPYSRRPSTLDLKSTPSKPASRVTSFRRTPNCQTPRIVEEDESLTIAVCNALPQFR